MSKTVVSNGWRSSSTGAGYLRSRTIDEWTQGTGRTSQEYGVAMGTVCQLLRPFGVSNLLNLSDAEPPHAGGAASSSQPWSIIGPSSADPQVPTSRPTAGGIQQEAMAASLSSAPWRADERVAGADPAETVRYSEEARVRTRRVGRSIAKQECTTVLAINP